MDDTEAMSNPSKLSLRTTHTHKGNTGNHSSASTTQQTTPMSTPNIRARLPSKDRHSKFHHSNLRHTNKCRLLISLRNRLCHTSRALRQSPNPKSLRKGQLHLRAK
jgi:hypothetical protein